MSQDKKMNYEANARRQTERLLANAVEDAENEEVEDFESYARSAKESKTKLLRQVACLSVVAFLISVLTFFVFLVPVRMSEDTYHGDFSDFWGKLTASFREAPQGLQSVFGMVKGDIIDS